MMAHDLFNELQCRTGMDTSACDVPKAMSQYADAFELTQPLCNPKVIMGIVKRNFPKSTELMQAGATVTVGSALFSILYPIKIGFFGYVISRNYTQQIRIILSNSSKMAISALTLHCAAGI